MSSSEHKPVNLIILKVFQVETGKRLLLLEKQIFMTKTMPIYESHGKPLSLYLD